MAIKSVKYGLKSYNISYELLNTNCEKSVLFLHGWGANKQIMKKAFEKGFSGYKHIYIDMPGFGSSDIFTPLHTSDYAKIVKRFLSELKSEPEIIVGHSFGGKVATLIAPKNLVLLSSAGIVVKKSFVIRFKIFLFKILKFFGFGKFYRFFATKDVSGMSRTMYETLKNVVDEDFSSKFKALKSKTMIFWGENDKATPLKSGEYMHSFIKNSSFHPLVGDHFFFLLHSDFINEQVQKEMKISTNLKQKQDIYDGIESI